MVVLIKRHCCGTQHARQDSSCKPRARLSSHNWNMNTASCTSMTTALYSLYNSHFLSLRFLLLRLLQSFHFNEYCDKIIIRYPTQYQQCIKLSWLRCLLIYLLLDARCNQIRCKTKSLRTAKLNACNDIARLISVTSSLVYSYSLMLL